MRTAGRIPPWIATLPTPDTSDSRGTITVSAMSLSARSPMVFDARASVMIGASAGFTLE